MPLRLEYDLKRGMSDPQRIRIVMALLRKVRNTIVRQPMHYIGSAIERGGLIYGGSFVAGTHSIIFKWAEFTSGLARDLDFQTSDLIGLLSDRESVRDVEQARRFYRDILESEGLTCIWSGRRISQDMHLDHMLPFSALGNNDFWNLLPVREAMNSNKRDAIPTLELLGSERVKERIIGIWERLVNSYRDQFFREIGIALLGRRELDPTNWQNACYHGLRDMSSYLINQRGLTPWKYLAK